MGTLLVTTPSILKYTKERRTNLLWSINMQNEFSSHSLLGFFTSLKTFFGHLVDRLRFHRFFLVTTASRNWQKMSHLGSPADKRCDIFTTGILICCCHSARPYTPLGPNRLDPVMERKCQHTYPFLIFGFSTSNCKRRLWLLVFKMLTNRSY